MDKPTAYIHQWRLYGDSLIGRISDHPRQREFRGPLQITSPIVIRPAVLEPGAKVTTMNTVYILGNKWERPKDGSFTFPYRMKVGG